MCSDASCQPDASPARPRAGLLRSHWPFVVVAAPALVLYLAYGFVVRLDYGPDEPEQLQYVYILADEGRLPVLEDTHMARHGPVYFALMSVPYRLAGGMSDPMSIEPGPGRLATFAPDDIRVRRVLRVVQSLLAMATLLAVYATLRRLLPDRPWCQVVPLAMLAGAPQFAIVASVVNNEQLAYLWSALACFFLAPLVVGQGEPTYRQALWLGAWIGAGAAVKETTLFVAPVAIVLLLLRCRRPRAKLLLSALNALALVCAAFWWPLRNYLATGHLLGSGASPSGFESYVRSAVVLDPFGEGLRYVVRFAHAIGVTTFSPEWAWATEGFIRRAHPTALFTLMVVAMAACYVVAALRARGASQSEGRHWRISALSVALSAAAVLAMWASILHHAFWLDLKLSVGGRYLLNAYPWFAVILLGAEERLAALVPSARVRHGAAMVALCGIAIGALWFLTRVAEWYARIG